MHGKPIVVLVVEEDVGVREILRFGLSQKGFTVKLACNGKEAVDLFRAMAGEIDVVLLDWGMDGMTGRETLEALRQIDPKVRCSFMSGGPGTNAPVDTPMMAKPFTMDTVIRVLQNLVK